MAPDRRGATWALPALLLACGHASAPAPPPPSTESDAVVVRGETEGCDDPAFHRFTDPYRRFSFCAPAGSNVRFHRAVEEAATVEQMWLSPDPRSTFSVAVISPAPAGGLEPPPSSADTTVDLDEEVVFAGEPARHHRLRWHDEGSRASARDAQGRHYHEDIEPTDVAVEHWALLLPDGARLTVTVRTETGTSDAARALLARIPATVRLMHSGDAAR